MGAEPIIRLLTPHLERDCLAYDLFAGDRCDERILSDKIVTARKSGPCCICLEDIKPGERVRRQAAIVDGEMFSCRICEVCCVAAAVSWEDNGAAIEERTTMGMRNSGHFPWLAHTQLIDPPTKEPDI